MTDLGTAGLSRTDPALDMSFFVVLVFGNDAWEPAILFFRELL